MSERPDATQRSVIEAHAVAEAVAVSSEHQSRDDDEIDLGDFEEHVGGGRFGDTKPRFFQPTFFRPTKFQVPTVDTRIEDESIFGGILEGDWVGFVAHGSVERDDSGSLKKVGLDECARGSVGKSGPVVFGQTRPDGFGPVAEVPFFRGYGIVGRVTHVSEPRCMRFPPAMAVRVDPPEPTYVGGRRNTNKPASAQLARQFARCRRERFPVAS